LSSDWNIFSAPEAAEPDAPDDAPELGEGLALGDAVLPPEAPLEALSPAAVAASGNAKAAATDSAMRVFIFIISSPFYNQKPALISCRKESGYATSAGIALFLPAT
jgi:hypothetical protein